MAAVLTVAAVPGISLAAKYESPIVPVPARVPTHELSALTDYARTAPHAEWAVPTTEHFDPLFVTMGAAHDFSMRTFAFAG